MTAAIRRPLNWYGSKERQCATIHALIPPGPQTWVDLFCGSGIVTLRKVRHTREVVNDLHGDVVNLFEILRGDKASELYRQIELTPYSEEVLRRVYAAPPAVDTVLKAWQFVVTSWLSRGGDCYRTGFRWSKGQTTAPERTWAEMPERLRAVAERLRGVCIRSTDALALIDDYDTADCVLFLDPPYPGAVGARYAHRMSGWQHRSLAERLRECSARVILTMNPGTVYSKVLSDWYQHDVSVQGGGQKSKSEIILTNYEPLPLLRFGAGAA